jgi:hypothetical protein
MQSIHGYCKETRVGVITTNPILLNVGSLMVDANVLIAIQ